MREGKLDSSYTCKLTGRNAKEGNQIGRKKRCDQFRRRRLVGALRNVPTDGITAGGGFRCARRPALTTWPPWLRHYSLYSIELAI